MVIDLLLPYQQRWVQDRSPLKVCVKSRRIGITWATACEMVLVSAARTGSDCWYVSYNESDAIDFIRDAADWTRLFGLAAETFGETIIGVDGESILVQRIKFSSGHHVTAMSSHPRNLRGKDGYAVIDEAAYHADLDEMIKAALAFGTWGGRVAVISTHAGKDNPFAKLCDDVRAGMTGATLHEVTIYDALRDGLHARIAARKGEVSTPESEAEWLNGLRARYRDSFAEEYECIPSRSGAVYLPRDLVEACTHDAPVIRYACDDTFVNLSSAARDAKIEAWCDLVLAPLLAALPKHRDHYFGQDFGRVSDLTVMVPITLRVDMTRAIPFTIELRNMPFESQRRVLYYVCDRMPNLRGGALDATGNGAYLGEQAVERYGSKMRAMSLSEQWYRDNMPPLRDAIEQRTLLIPRDADTVADLGAIRVINGVPKLTASKTKSIAEGGKVTRHGDAAVAIALAYTASREPSLAAPRPSTTSRAEPWERPQRVRLGWR